MASLKRTDLRPGDMVAHLVVLEQRDKRYLAKKSDWWVVCDYHYSARPINYRRYLQIIGRHEQVMGWGDIIWLI